MNYYEQIKKRKSYRAFKNKAVPKEILDTLQEHHKNCDGLIPDIQTQIRILGPEAETQLAGICGYKGFMIGAPAYLLLLTQEHTLAGENAGYVGESLVLTLTELGMGCCWLTFDDPGAILGTLGVDTTFTVGAIIAFGYGKEPQPRTKIHKETNAIVTVTEEKFYRNEKITIQELLHLGQWGNKEGIDSLPSENIALWDALHAATLSPSYLNRQPYRILLDGDNVVLILLPDEYSSPYDLKLDIGILMLHFAAVFSERIHRVAWAVKPPETDYGLPEGAKAYASCSLLPRFED